MKKVLIGLWTLLALPGLVRAWDCSCTAPDGSCSAQVSCTNGCYATCGSTCMAGCSNSRGPGGGPQSPSKNLAPISLEVESLGAEDLSAVLSKQLGARVAYASPQPLNLDIHGLGVEDVLNVLSKSGAVAILHSAGDAEPARIGPGAMLSLRANEVPGSAVAEVLSRVSGGAILFSPDDAQQTISLDLKELTAREVVRILSSLGQARLVPR